MICDQCGTEANPRVHDNEQCVAALRAQLATAREALLLVEHVRNGTEKFARCPLCRSPNDYSEPHEIGCKIDAALAALAKTEEGKP